MADIGRISLLLALFAAVYSAAGFFIGAKRGHPGLVRSARNGVLAVCGLATIATASLVYAIVTHDFQLEYVASYTSRDLSLVYLLSTLWAGNAGSLLFWAWLLSIFSAVMVFQRRDTGRELVPYAGSVTMITAAFFFILLLFVASPFQRLSFVPPDGRGLNPLLENPGMFFHPPFLLAGYVGFTIPFGFAVAAMITRRLGDDWIIAVRRWALMAWLLLGIGNLFGAWWAYVELGWGGYWAWDPVENASLMPWLVITAFLHSIMMQRRRGMLKIWNMVLIILAFSLSILGTFLTRSGVIASVHTFAETPLLGTLFLVFIGISLLGSLGLLFYRSDNLKSDAEMESVVSRESTFLLNNLLLVGAAFAVLLGTFFPIISEAVRGVKVSVGPPFFNQVNAPIFLAIILLAGICTLIGWRKASVRNLWHNFFWPLVTVLAIEVFLFIIGIRQWYALIAFAICAFVLATIIYEWFRGTRARHQMKGDNYFRAFWGLIGSNRPRYGGYIVHLAVILMAAGVIGSSLYDASVEATLQPGESVRLQRYILTYDNIDQYETESKQVVSTSLSVYNSGHLLGQLTPEKYFHHNYDQAVSEVAIRSTLLEDLYVILVGWEDTGATSFKVIINPLVSWIWLGGIVFVLGGLLAFWPERRRPASPNDESGRST
ncbi:MAG: cytochrome C biogenesis protein [Chloroflexi bacterium RBG_16_56_11]|nr:MAG: cytochrome C biogenesis protein [Chloroflexi bacterium RBG_16_56_11]